jgi:hypothetical protein
MKYPPAPLTPFLASLLCIRRRTHTLIEPRESKDLNQLSASATTACSLFALSLQRFRPLACLFSTACSLFCKNTRGGGIPIRCVDSRRESTKTPDAGDGSAGYSGRVSLCDTSAFSAPLYPELRGVRYHLHWFGSLLCFHNLTNPYVSRIDKYVPPFHKVTNPSPRNLFLFTSIQNPRVATLPGLQSLPCVLCVLCALCVKFFSSSFALSI